MTTTRTRKQRCTKCRGRVATIEKHCLKCYLEAEQKAEAIRQARRMRQAEDERIKRVESTIQIMREAMTPILGNDGTEVGFDGFTNIKKKQVGWRCKRCGAACNKRACLLCERSVV